jgi:hypothetical protein
MCCFEQARQFIGRNHGNSLVAFAANDNDLAIIYDPVHHRSEIFAQTGVRGFNHDSIVQDPCTYCNAVILLAGVVPSSEPDQVFL